MSNCHRICVLPGDGIGPEVVAAALDVLQAVQMRFNERIEFCEAPIGGMAIDEYGTALPDETLDLARSCDAVMLGAVGGPKWDTVQPGCPRPEDGLLGIRKELGLFANLRPVHVYAPLASHSPLKMSKVENADILIVRELTGGLYFGDHVTRTEIEGAGVGGSSGTRAYDVMIYDEYEIERIGRKAFEAARMRKGKLTSVDKANVLDTGQLWRRVIHEIAADFPDVELADMLVDNCAMQLIRDPSQFDVIVTENTFGDILTDEASVLAGSLGLLASASLGNENALYEPCHGSAPDIAGKNIANPIGQIQSAAMMLEYSLCMPSAARAIEDAVNGVLEEGWRTFDIASDEISVSRVLGTHEMGEKIAQRIKEGI